MLTTPTTIRVGNWPKNKFSLVMLWFPVGTVKLLTSTRRSEYFAVPCCKALMCASCTAGLGFTLRTNKVTSYKDTLFCAWFAFPCKQKRSLERIRRKRISTPFSKYRFWKNKSRCTVVSLTYWFFAFCSQSFLFRIA